MANLEQLNILKGCIAKIDFSEWNAYRRENPDADPFGFDPSHLSAGLMEADLKDADLRGAVLWGADLRGADLKGADLRGANLSGGADLLEADLKGADLRGANLGKAQLSRANLSEARLSGTRPVGADLSRANLSGADLSRAHLAYADLKGADLRGADLKVSDLAYADLKGADLSGADLSYVILNETAFVNVDLSRAKGLSSCFHYGPSILDHRTLTRSGRLPLEFLRGCGLPDNLIEFLPSLLTRPAIQFYSCFISYSTHDQDFADRLHEDLQNKGVRCWFAPHDVRSGKKLHEQIDAAIRLHDRLLLILSEHSMNSVWVKTEIANARQKEVNEKRRVLYPIRLVSFESIKTWKNFDADTGTDSAREIREYFIPDFSQWKTDQEAYLKAFNRLMNDLRTESERAAGSE